MRDIYCADEPGALFHSLHQAHRRQVFAQQAARGVGDLGAPMLLLVLLEGEHRGRTYSQRELARQLRLSPATVATSLKSLERSGYVARQTDERDARRNRVTLTEKGRRAVDTCGTVFRSVDEKMLLGFSPAERDQLTSFFVRMLENLGGPPEFPVPPPPVVQDPSAEKEET